MDLYSARTLADVAAMLLVSPKKLKYVLYARPVGDRYTSFSIPKRRGGFRIIHSPRKELKHMQQNLAAELYRVYRPRFAVQGFAIGRSIATNAELHLPARYVFNVDLKDFFPSINFGRVRGLFLKPPFSLPATVATILAQVCCHKNSLPQGAPTSPVVSNMICARLDRELTAVAKLHRCWY